MSNLPLKALFASLVSTAALQPSPASACGLNSFLGEICASAYNFCPTGFLPANGQILAISQYTALFSLLGTNYGGNGTTNFALPDLRGRTAVGAGNGPGLSAISVGETGGSEKTTLTTANLPSHSHAATTVATVTSTLNAASGTGNNSSPANKLLATSTLKDNLYSNSTSYTPMASGAVKSTATAGTTIGTAGGGTNPAIPTRSPYLGITYCIAITGIFPSRN